MIPRAIASSALLLALAACGTLPFLPQDLVVDGPSAIVCDGHDAVGTNRSDIYYLDQVDEQRIRSSWTEAGQRNANLGLKRKFQPNDNCRAIPAGRPVKLELRASTSYVAPIIAMFNENWSTSGTLSFTPTAGATYLVKGDLGAHYLAVWLEDNAGGGVVDHKFETGHKAD